MKRHNLGSTEAITVVNSKRSTTHGHLNALRDIKESSGIKIKNKIGEAYEKRHVSNNATLPTFCIFVSLFVCLFVASAWFIVYSSLSTSLIKN